MNSQVMRALWRHGTRLHMLWRGLIRLPHCRTAVIWKRPWQPSSLGAAVSGEPLSAVLIDLDNLKAINDVWSHQAGDEALHRAAEVARSTWRATDLLGRWGGDEFLVIMPGASIQLARSLARRFCRNLARADFRVGVPRTSLRLSAGAGAAETRASAEGTAGLFAAADAALYRAKRRVPKRASWLVRAPIGTEFGPPAA
jgi:diguanylate cyclase (GGDEF)-like protein